MGRRAALRVVSAQEARTLFLDAQDLLRDPSGRCTLAALRACIRRLGYLQIDAIRVVERAHHLTLASRFDAYRPCQLDALFEDRRELFEQWTHNASIVPIEHYPHWQRRFREIRRRIPGRHVSPSRLGDELPRAIAHVRRRIAREGPLRARDFEDEARLTGGFTDWRPRRFALDLCWRAGFLAISARRDFEKLFDLAERTHPEAHAAPAPSPAQSLDWACRTALDGLGVATAGEVMRYWRAEPLPRVRAWCERATARGELEEVWLESAAGGRLRAYAPADWEVRLARVRTAPRRTRLLSPFDPLVHDRVRLLRLFGFDYRLECYVPRSRRSFGYYVMPLLEGDRIVGRVDPRYRRDAATLEVRRIWWEPGIEATPRRMRALERGVERVARLVEAERVELPRRGATAVSA